MVNPTPSFFPDTVRLGWQVCIRYGATTEQCGWTAEENSRVGQAEARRSIRGRHQRLGDAPASGWAAAAIPAAAGRTLFRVTLPRRTRLVGVES